MQDSAYKPSERRPIASRETGWARAAASWLARKNVSANTISVTGMVCGTAAGAALALTAYCALPFDRIAWLAGALFAQVRLLANLLDGMVAIESGKASPVGELYNEVPDRISDSAILVGLGYAAGGYPALGWFAALAAIFTAYVRAQGKAAGAPNDFGGPMAKPQRMFTVTVIALFCAVTPEAWQPRSDAGFGMAAGALLVIAIGSLLTAWRRLQRTATALRRGLG